MKMRFVKRSGIKMDRKGFPKGTILKTYAWENRLIELITHNSTNLLACFDTISEEYNVPSKTVENVYYRRIRPNKTVLELKFQNMPNVKNRPRWANKEHAQTPVDPLQSLENYLSPLNYDPGYGS